MRSPAAGLCLGVVVLIVPGLSPQEPVLPPAMHEAYDQIKRILTQAIASASNHTQQQTVSARSVEGNEMTSRMKKKFQDSVPENTPFPCDTRPGAPGARSATRPTSVHRLRPGDIDVVGALGDSVIAGNGAASFNLVEVYVENRGMSLSIGGDSTWREHLTIPNILKEFNPNLVGYSLGASIGSMKDAQFNVAEPIAMNRDLLFQAKLFERRVRADKRVNFEQDWKLLTVMIGHNDFCSDMCYRNWTVLPENTVTDLETALDYLHDNVPRILVSLVIPLNVAEVRAFTNPPIGCQMFWRMACSCFFGQRWQHMRPEFERVVRRCQHMYFEIGYNKRYFDKEDFAVVVQPYLVNTTFPMKISKNKRVTDYSYFAADCFHLSQKGHALAANSLWNNMLEPVGNKSIRLTPRLFAIFLCPTVGRPYIFTAQNSNEPPVAGQSNIGGKESNSAEATEQSFVAANSTKATNNNFSTKSNKKIHTSEQYNNNNNNELSSDHYIDTKVQDSNNFAGVTKVKITSGTPVEALEESDYSNINENTRERSEKIRTSKTG